MGQTGNHTLQSGSTLQSLTARSDGEAKFHSVVKGGQVGLSMRSMYMDLGIQMKVEILIDSSTANSLTVRLGAGPRTKHIDTRQFHLSIKKVPTAKNGADVGTKRVSASLLQQYCTFAGLVFH